jgi:hypothetical protein
MGRERAPWALPLVELPIGAVGICSRGRTNEADDTWWAWASWVQETGGRHVHKVIQVPTASLLPLEPPEACQKVLRWVRGLDGKIRDAG